MMIFYVHKLIQANEFMLLARKSHIVNIHSFIERHSVESDKYSKRNHYAQGTLSFEQYILIIYISFINNVYYFLIYSDCFSFTEF